jgi:hypothetical protein
MTRLVRGQIMLVSITALLALTMSVTFSAPLAAAAPAHSAKKSKKHKKSKRKHGTKAKKTANATVTGGTETLTFNTTAAQALEKGKVSTTLVNPASGSLATGFVFQLSGGTLNPSTGLGSLTSTGGVTFATSFSVPGLFSSESNATISEPSLALNSAPTLSFTSQQANPPTFPFGTVSLKGVHPSSHGGSITLADLPVALTSAGARFLNEFAAGSFTAGEAIGTVTIDATTGS